MKTLVDLSIWIAMKEGKEEWNTQLVREEGGTLTANRTPIVNIHRIHPITQGIRCNHVLMQKVNGGRVVTGDHSYVMVGEREGRTLKAAQSHEW
jgi:hypothetical protein